MRILVTGANGFVGKELISNLRNLGHEVVPAVRSSCGIEGEKIIGDIDATTQWTNVLTKVNVVIHLAARVHVMRSKSESCENLFRIINIEGTLNLAKQAADAGVKRLIFLSSIKVNGEFTSQGKAFSANDLPDPMGAYACSKWEAEKGLLKISQDTGLEVVIVRPPLVYGPGVKANFLSLIRWVKKGIPLPFGSVDNRRSLVALGNLLSLLVICIDHPKAANEVFLVSDGEDLSIEDLIRRLGKSMNRPAKIIPYSGRFINLALGVLGKQDLGQRLFGNLQVDIRKNKDVLGWTPKISVDEGLRRVSEGRLSLSKKPMKEIEEQ